MLEFDGLTISQLKISYKMFLNHNTTFHIKNLKHKNVDGSNLDYYYTDDRILFYPVTVNPKAEPSASDLRSLLEYFISKVSINGNVKRIVVPIGEISRPFDVFPTIHHMVTLIIDFLPTNYGSEIFITRNPVAIKIIDSYRFSFPGCQQTSDILSIIGNFYHIIDFKREYLAHQNWLDRRSCCYFTLKVLQKAFEEPIRIDKTFLKTVPEPDTWISTSHNWLTLHNKKEIVENLTTYFQNINRNDGDIEQIIDEIIELD